MEIQRKRAGTRHSCRCLVYVVLSLANLGQQAACKAFWPVMAVPVQLPALPLAWSGAEGWEVDWRSLDLVGESLLASPGDSLVLFLPRTGFAAVRCKPVFGSARGLPYGALWPQDSGPEIRLSPGPEGGLAAELAFRLYQGGYDPAKFNLRRFTLEAELRMTDPWDSDMASLARAAAEGRFRADYLKTPARYPLAVWGLPGPMAADSPWGQVLMPDDQGQASLTVSPGIHRWFGGAQELVVSVSAEGSTEWMLRSLEGRVREKILP